MPPAPNVRFVHDCLLQLSEDRDEALHCKPFYSVLLVYGNNAYQLYSVV